MLPAEFEYNVCFFFARVMALTTQSSSGLGISGTSFHGIPPPMLFLIFESAAFFLAVADRHDNGPGLRPSRFLICGQGPGH